MSHLANSYYRNPLRIEGIVILRPDKGSGVVIMDKITYKSKIVESLSDESKFKQLSSDAIKLREGKGYLRK